MLSTVDRSSRTFQRPTPQAKSFCSRLDYGKRDTSGGNDCARGEQNHKPARMTLCCAFQCGQWYDFIYDEENNCNFLTCASSITTCNYHKSQRGGSIPPKKRIHTYTLSARSDLGCTIRQRPSVSVRKSFWLSSTKKPHVGVFLPGPFLWSTITYFKCQIFQFLCAIYALVCCLVTWFSHFCHRQKSKMSSSLGTKS